MHKITVCEHPFIQHRLTILRDKSTPVHQFRLALRECGALMAYEMAKDHPTKTVRVQTPLEPANGLRIETPVVLIAILRAALGMVEGMAEFYPDSRIGHLGMYRDPRTLQPVFYYSKLPADLNHHPIILADPMLATGGSIVAALDELKKFDCLDAVKIATLIAAPEGIARVREKYPDVPIYTAAVDRQLNEKGYILPGLGDAGDRQYGTA